MEPDEIQRRRLCRASPQLPLWFASPLLAARPDTVISRRIAALLRPGKAKHTLIVFNVGRLEALLPALPPSYYSIVALWQWRPLEHLSALKRVIYRMLLARAAVILTYSRASEAYLRAKFPGKHIEWIGHFVDTEFFQPSAGLSAQDDFLLCPGDNSRLEDIVVQIAERCRARVVRVSNAGNIKAHYRERRSPLVSFHGSVSFDELRRLYNSARLVINVANDRLWPVGITVFCEALAMNKIVITPNGHSCSGYAFADGARPYAVISNPFEINEWVAAVEAELHKPRGFEPGRSPRDLALTFCAFEKCKRQWQAILDSLR